MRKSLDQDGRLVANEIGIRTSLGEVTLDGSVYSDYEKGIAEQDAKNVVGVAWVKNNLFVRADQREDWAIADDVHFNLNTDAVTEGFGLGTSVTNGTVTLTGTVHSWYQWSHAYDVAVPCSWRKGHDQQYHRVRGELIRTGRIGSRMRTW